MYIAPGTAHVPNHAPKEWIEKFRGQFDKGWDQMRVDTFARQKAEGVIPANADLTPRPKAIPAWDSLSAPQQRLYARMMEVYAGSLAYADNQIRSEEHTSELQSIMRTSYAVFCLKKK